MQDPKVAKNRLLGTTAQLCRSISLQLRHVSTIGKQSVKQQYVANNMVNFDPLAAEIGLPVWGTPANFNRFRVLAALLHGSQVVSVSQTLRRWTEGATYVRQGDDHVGHWPTFLIRYVLIVCDCCLWRQQINWHCCQIIFTTCYSAHSDNLHCCIVTAYVGDYSLHGRVADVHFSAKYK